MTETDTAQLSAAEGVNVEKTDSAENPEQQKNLYSVAELLRLRVQGSDNSIAPFIALVERRPEAFESVPGHPPGKPAFSGNPFGDSSRSHPQQNGDVVSKANADWLPLQTPAKHSRNDRNNASNFFAQGQTQFTDQKQARQKYYNQPKPFSRESPPNYFQSPEADALPWLLQPKMGQRFGENGGLQLMSELKNSFPSDNRIEDSVLPAGIPPHDVPPHTDSTTSRGGLLEALRSVLAPGANITFKQDDSRNAQCKISNSQVPQPPVRQHGQTSSGVNQRNDRSSPTDFRRGQQAPIGEKPNVLAPFGDVQSFPNASYGKAPSMMPYNKFGRRPIPPPGSNSRYNEPLLGNYPPFPTSSNGPVHSSSSSGMPTGMPCTDRQNVMQMGYVGNCLPETDYISALHDSKENVWSYPDDNMGKNEFDTSILRALLASSQQNPDAPVSNGLHRTGNLTNKSVAANGVVAPPESRRNGGMKSQNAASTQRFSNNRPQHGPSQTQQIAQQIRLLKEQKGRPRGDFTNESAQNSVLPEWQRHAQQIQPLRQTQDQSSYPKNPSRCNGEKNGAENSGNNSSALASPVQ